jgi:hypothetical protein
MKNFVLLFAVVSLSLLVASCQGGLPEGAREAIDKKIEGIRRGATYTLVSYTITSAEKATKPNVRPSDNYDEVWCVSLDVHTDEHICAWDALVLRTGNYWEMDLTNQEENFLKRGCGNFDDSGCR